MRTLFELVAQAAKEAEALDALLEGALLQSIREHPDGCPYPVDWGVIRDNFNGAEAFAPWRARVEAILATGDAALVSVDDSGTRPVLYIGPA